MLVPDSRRTNHSGLWGERAKGGILLSARQGHSTASARLADGNKRKNACGLREKQGTGGVMSARLSFDC